MIRAFNHFYLAFFEEVLIHTLRGSLVLVALLPLIGSSGAWKYLSSSWSAVDMQRTAAWTRQDRLPSVVVVAIDDVGYQSFFSAKSPLNREKVAQLLQTITTHSPSLKRVAIDLDLSPVPEQAAGQTKLDQLFLQKPSLWVLAAVNSGGEKDIAEQRSWRANLCKRGVSFGLPYVPNEFGYPKLNSQYVNSLADTALQAPGVCADPADEMPQKHMVLSPAGLQSGLMVPFNGDLDQLGMILDSLNPQWVIVGGSWGQTDVFGTPFGDRFGVQVHSAALDGALLHEHEASHLVAIFSAFMFISLCSVLLKYMNEFFQHLFAPPLPQMVGHGFYVERLQPVMFVAMVFLMLLLLTEGLSIVRAYTGYWIPTAIVGSMTLGMLLLTWNWGQNKAAEHESFHHMWQHTVSHPIHMDLVSIATSWRVLRNGPTPKAWGAAEDAEPIGRGRALLEGFFAVVSLTVQTMVPVGMLLYAIFGHSAHG